MTGIGWHVEKMERQEGDDRRHRSRCVHYSGKKDAHCSYYSEKCRGAAHCSHYSEKIIDKSNDEFILPKANREKHPTVPIVSFTGIKYIKIEDIQIDHKFIGRSPKEKKVKQVMEYYKERGSLDKPVIVSCGKNKYVLEDKYLRYVVAKQLGLTVIPAEMGT